MTKGLIQMTDKGLLLVVSGPSGVGKGTVCSEYIKQHPDCKLSVSATTRAPRDGEREGVNYYYLSEEEFRNKIDSDGFLEHAVFCGNYYGTPKDTVMQMLDESKDVILEIEVQGAMQVRTHYPEAVLVFVVPPSMDTLSERLRGRNTETEDVIAQRLTRAKDEFKYIEKYNYVLLNDTVEKATERLGSIVCAEKCRIERTYGHLKKEFID